jgi:DNA-binding MarR family transcriptional regulator
LKKVRKFAPSIEIFSILVMMRLDLLSRSIRFSHIKGENGCMTKSLELDRFLPYRLNVVAATLSFLFEERVLQTSRITFPQWRILGVLGSEGPTAQQNFVKRSKMDKITISRAVTDLIGMGAVVSVQSTDDRRARILHLTDNGRHLYKTLARQALEVESQKIPDIFH